MFLTDASAIDMVTVSGRRVLFSVLTHIFVLDHISDLTSSTFELYCPGLDWPRFLLGVKAFLLQKSSFHQGSPLFGLLIESVRRMLLLRGRVGHVKGVSQ